MTQRDILQFYGTSQYPKALGSPDGDWHDDALAWRKGLILHMRQEMLQDLSGEVIKELQHLVEEGNALLLREEEGVKTWFEALDLAVAWDTFAEEDPGRTPDDLSALVDETLEGAIRTASQANQALIADPMDPRGWDLAQRAFMALVWDYSYGGMAWAGVADGGHGLATARTLGDMEVHLDRCISIMHNSSPVVEDFPSGEVLWLFNALTARAGCEEGWHYNLPVHSAEKGRLAPDTDPYVGMRLGFDAYAEEPTPYSLDCQWDWAEEFAGGVLEGIIDFLEGRVCSLMYQARARFSQPLEVLGGSDRRVRALFKEMLLESLPRCEEPIVREAIRWTDLERRAFCQLIQRRLEQNAMINPCIGRNQEMKKMRNDSDYEIQGAVMRALLHIQRAVQP